MSINNPLWIDVNSGTMTEKVNALINVMNAVTNEMYEGRVPQAQADIQTTSEKVASMDETQKISFETLANGGQIDEQTVLAHKDNISEWAVGITYKVDQYVRYLNVLYKVIQEHTSQADWTPNVTASLYTVIDLEHTGTLEDPIPFTIGMEVYSGNYYTYDDVLYLCIRDSGTALYHEPSALLGNYFELVE